MKPVDIVIIVFLAIWFVVSVAVILRAHKKGGSCCHCSKECRSVCKGCKRHDADQNSSGI